MAKSDGTVYINTLLDTSGFRQGVASAEKQINLLKTSIKTIGKTIAAAFAVKQLADFGKEAIELGSDLEEVQNVVDVTFQTMSDQVNEFAENAAKTAGMSETMAKKYAGTFGAMAKAFGFAEGQAFDMSTALTTLAGDVASFYNLTQDEAYTKLKSVFTGETESLKDLGVVMTQAALDSFAMAKGWGKTTKEMSEQEKVALRYAFVIDQLSAASGDFARTQDSWANQTRILSLNFDSFKANLGKALINIFTPFLKVINQIVEKMAQLSKHFVAFSELLVGKSTSGGGGSPGNTLGEIVSGYEDVTDAANKATKAQNKYLSGLDEIKTFSSNQNTEQKTDINITNPETTKKENEKINESSALIDKVIKKVKELKKVFSSGFTFGFGDTTERINDLRKSLELLKINFDNIFDVDLSKGFNSSLERILFSAGQITGAFASIGLTIATNLLGGFSGFIESEKGNIKNYLLSMFDIGSEVSEKAGEVVSALAYIFEEFANEDGQKISEDIFGIFFTAFSNVTELASRFGLDVISLIIDPFVDSKDELKKSVQDMLSGIGDFTGEIRRILDEGFKEIWGLYEKHIQPIFENLIPDMEKLWQEHIAPLLSKVGEFFGELGKNIGYFWDEILKPLIQWFSENVMPVISPILEGILRLFISVFGSIADIIGSFLDLINGLLKFINGVFSGDWELAWEGIKEIFSAVFDAFESIVKGPLNAVIDILNGLINAVASGFNFIIEKINSVGFEIPEWIPFVGGKSFGIDIPTIPNIKIPYLATGAVIPPNAPFMAMLGDQKSGNNLEAPESLIRKIVREESGNGNASGNVTLPVYIDGTKLFEIMISKAKLLQASTGQNLFVEL